MHSVLSFAASTRFDVGKTAKAGRNNNKSGPSGHADTNVLHSSPHSEAVKLINTNSKGGLMENGHLSLCDCYDRPHSESVDSTNTDN